MEVTTPTVRILPALTIRIYVNPFGKILRAPPTRTASIIITSKKHQALQWRSSCQVYLKQKIDNDPVVRPIKLWFVWRGVAYLKYTLQYKHHSFGTTPHPTGEFLRQGWSNALYSLCCESRLIK